MKASGKNKKILIGLQADKSTVAADFKILPAVTCNIGEKSESKKSDVLNGNRFTTGKRVFSLACDGDLTIKWTKKTLLTLLKYAGYADTVSDVTVGEYAGKKKHTLKTKNTVDDFLTITEMLTDVDYYEENIGCKIDTLKLDIVKQAYMEGSFSVKGIKQNKDDVAYTHTGTSFDDAKKQLVCFNTSSIVIDGIEQIGLMNKIGYDHNNALDGNDYVLNKLERDDLTAQDGEIKLNIEANFDKTSYIAWGEKRNKGEPAVVTIKLVTDETKTEPDIIMTVHQFIFTDRSKSSGAERITATLAGEALFDETKQTVMTIEIIDNE